MYILKYMISSSESRAGRFYHRDFILIIILSVKIFVLSSSHLFIFKLILPAVRHSHLYFTLFEALILFFRGVGGLCGSSADEMRRAHIFANIPLSFLRVWPFLSVLSRGNK